ncbi:DUF3084 domain-containing protein [Deinococcus cellulosilyticus]|uniref:DUF3084 domain-containing protein n=1 Tax=Deinococcus cellulosilyticus (strain DSM 18568 / NBRC 106333 / KACC 11606 / 5516J-15) TaxID=1223518 RepID=A0A511N8N6_DEIC1|nr:DUF3084 domain-containing protein [Deinococcus cellulosilyticus]GEM49194.1 hypothetical protein DC3_48290 [Deinococcus cellulosilyticus NBRC 106333 = KACC 11606]
MLWVLLVFVVLLAGLIAYVADNVARRVGRRHIRLFGLRPKTTALIYAVATGMGISFLSMLGFALVNQQAIVTISKAEQYRKELQELQVQIAPLRKNKEELEAALKVTQDNVVRLSSEREAALKARDSLKKESDSLKAEVNELKEYRVALESQNQKLNSRAAALFQQGQVLEQSIRELEIKSTNLEAQNKKLRSSYDQMVADLTTEREQYQKIQTEYQQALAQYQSAQQQIKQISPTINALRTEQKNLKKENESLKKARQAAQGEVSGLQYLRAQLIKESEDLKKDNAQLRGSIKKMTEEIAELKSESSQLKVSLDQQRTELEARRTQDAIFEKGDLVFQGVYQADEGIDALDRAIRQAELKAISRGARGKPSALLVGEDQVSVLSQNLRNLNGEVLVVIRATNNQIKGFPVSVDMQLLDNRVLYVREQPIRSRLINVGPTGVKTNRELTQFLQNLALDAIKSLQEQGIPLENLPSGLSTADTVNMVNSLKTLKGSVLVGIVSRADIKPSSKVVIYPRILR